MHTVVFAKFRTNTPMSTGRLSQKGPGLSSSGHILHVWRISEKSIAFFELPEACSTLKLYRTRTANGTLASGRRRNNPGINSSTNQHKYAHTPHCLLFGGTEPRADDARAPCTSLPAVFSPPLSSSHAGGRKDGTSPSTLFATQTNDESHPSHRASSPQVVSQPTHCTAERRMSKLEQRQRRRTTTHDG